MNKYCNKTELSKSIDQYVAHQMKKRNLETAKNFKKEINNK